MKLKLACPACGTGGSWTVRGDLETWTGPDLQQTAMVSGPCDRCGSLVLFAPTDEAVARIRIATARARVKAAADG